MRKILIITLKYLGDVVVATPVLRALHETFPDAKISVMVREGYEDALAGNPAVNEIISVPFESFRAGSIAERLYAQFKFIFELRRKHFDMVIAMEAGDREALFAFFSGASQRIGPDFQPLKFLFNKKISLREDSVNITDYNCAIAEAAGAIVTSIKTEMFVSRAATDWAKKIISDDAHENFIVGLHPGAREANRRWPAERWSALAARLIERGRVGVVLISSPQEHALADAVSASSPQSKKILRADDCSIQQMASVMQRCTLCVTCDSAPRHIAAAVGTRTVALIPEGKIFTWSLYDADDHAVIVGKSNGGDSLIESIDVDTVLAVIEKIFS